MGRKKTPQNQEIDDALRQKTKQQAFDIMLGFEDVLEPFSEQEQQDIRDKGEAMSNEVKQHQAQLLAEAIKQEQELVMMQSDYEVMKAQVIRRFPSLADRINRIEQTGERRRNEGAAKGITQGDVSKWV